MEKRDGQKEKEKKKKKKESGENAVTGTYPIGNSAAHTSNQRNRTPVPESNHLLRGCLGSHEHSRHVHFEHGVGVFGRVLQRRGFLLDAGRSNEAVQSAFGGGDGLDGFVE